MKKLVSKKSTPVKKYQAGGSAANMNALREAAARANSFRPTPKKTSGIPYKTGTSSPVQNTMRKGGKATMKKTRKCC